jgi:hypothetical protein
MVRSTSTEISPSETGELQLTSITSNQTCISSTPATSYLTGHSRCSKNPPFCPALTQHARVVQVVRKGVIRARPPTQHNVDKAPKAAGLSHCHHYALTLYCTHQRSLDEPDERCYYSQISRMRYLYGVKTWHCVEFFIEYATTDADDDSWVSKGVQAWASVR